MKIKNTKQNHVQFLNGNIPNHIENGYKLLNAPRKRQAEITMITSYPPRECGIATYSTDLRNSLLDKFGNSFSMSICALDNGTELRNYPKEVKYRLDINSRESFESFAIRVNTNPDIALVVLQHEFGLYRGSESYLHKMMRDIEKPVITAFHTVLPKPDAFVKQEMEILAGLSSSLSVMTQNSARILVDDYGISEEKISIIPHGTHLVSHRKKDELKKKYKLKGRKVLSTFGLLGPGKSIETTLEALPRIVRKYPEVKFLIIGKTHPTLQKREGEVYRDFLKAKISELGLYRHVQFINSFLPLAELLEYLQLSDIYLFTSKDPHQAVSGTFSYALSCGCPIISTPIPHAREVLQKGNGLLIDFQDHSQLADAVVRLLGDEELRSNIRSNALHHSAETAWENSAISHARLFSNTARSRLKLRYEWPEIKLDHLKKMTTDTGIIQFCKINQPDIDSGYTLDDNARALIVFCRHYELTSDPADLSYIHTYFNFIKYCLTPDGSFYNYVDGNKNYTAQNREVNLEDSNGRAIWALGCLLNVSDMFPRQYRYLGWEAQKLLELVIALPNISSPRAMAFMIKGLYFHRLKQKADDNELLIEILADRLVDMFQRKASVGWKWFEEYLTYANAVLPEALLCAWMATGKAIYRDVAKTSFDFLLSRIFDGSRIQVISNDGWLFRDRQHAEKLLGGEQPIDVAYTILALEKFDDVFPEEGYDLKMKWAFNWFLGENHLNQIIYNPCTTGCYDGLEVKNVNLNQGSESTICYLLSRLAMENKIKPVQETFVSAVKKKQRSTTDKI